MTASSHEANTAGAAALKRMRTGALTLRKPGSIRDTPPLLLTDVADVADAAPAPPGNSLGATLLCPCCNQAGCSGGSRGEGVPRAVTVVSPLRPVRLGRPKAALHAAPLLGLQLGSLRLSALIPLMPPLPPPAYLVGEAALMVAAEGSHASEPPEATLKATGGIRSGATARRGMMEVMAVLASSGSDWASRRML